MSSRKLTASDLFSFEEVANILADCTSYNQLCSVQLPGGKYTLGKISKVLPYFFKRESGARARYAVIPVREGCSVLPLLEGLEDMLVPLTDSYQLYSHDDTVALLEYHEKTATNISSVLRACLSFTPGTQRPLVCAMGHRIAPCKTEDGTYIICSVDDKGEALCRVADGEWVDRISAQSAIDSRTFPLREDSSALSFCHKGKGCFPSEISLSEGHK